MTGQVVMARPPKLGPSLCSNKPIYLTPGYTSDTRYQWEFLDVVSISNTLIFTFMVDHAVNINY